MLYSQCFICREWSYDAQLNVEMRGARLCLPCYVDVLEVKQARGELRKTEPVVDQLREGPDQSEPPSSYFQLDFFDA